MKMIRNLMEIAQTYRKQGLEQNKVGNYGLTEVFFQQSLLYCPQDEMIQQDYARFHNEQETSAGPFLKEIYQRIDSNKDGMDFIHLQEYYQQRKKLLCWLQEPFVEKTMRNQSVQAIEGCFHALQKDRKDRQKLIEFYETVRCAPAVDVITLLNELYDKDEDVDFLADTLHECNAGSVYIYYAGKSSRGIDKVIALKVKGEVEEASLLLTDELHRIERLLFFLAGRCGLGMLEFELAALPSKLQEAWTGLERIRLQRQRLADLCVQANCPLVSIMIPTYNMPRIFERTMRSAARQSYKNLEIIVCDNSTNDETEELMGKYRSDLRVRYFRNREAKTKEENFRPFQQLARGEYLQWLMHDDILMPNKIEKMAECLRKIPEVTLVSSQRGVIDVEGNFQQSWLQTNLPILGEYAIFPGEDIGRLFFQMVGNVIGEPSAVLFRRKDLEHHYWNADSKGYKTISDVVMWLELLEKGKCLLFREPLSYFRVFPEQEGQQPDVILLSRIEWTQLISEYYQRHIFVDQQDYHHVLEVLVKEYDTLPKMVNTWKMSSAKWAWKNYEACVEKAREILRQAGDVVPDI